MIPDGSLVVIDSVVLAYFFGRHPIHGADAEELVASLEEGRVQGIVSSLSYCDLLTIVFKKDAQGARALAREIDDFPNLKTVAVTTKISLEAARLKAAYNFRTPDAIQVATAIANRAHGLVTNNRKLTRIVEEGLRLWVI